MAQTTAIEWTEATWKLAKVSVEELLGTESQPATRGPIPKLQRQLEQLSQLPRSQQLDTVLQQAER